MGARLTKKKLVLRIVLGLVGVLVLAASRRPWSVPSEKWQQIAFDKLQEHTWLVATAESASVSHWNTPKG